MAVPFQLSASSAATQGDSQSQGQAENYFGASFAVGSGARATSEQSNGSLPNLQTVAILGVFGLVGLAIVARAIRK